MSKLLNPKVWYLVGIGAAALALDAGRRWVTKRRRESEQPVGHAVDHGMEIPMMSSEPARTTPAAKTRPTPQPAAAPNATRTTTTEKKAAKPDDLTAIKGIGPTFAKRLTEAGFTSFASLAGASPDHLREVTKAPPMANPDEWIAQARQLV